MSHVRTMKLKMDTCSERTGIYLCIVYKALHTAKGVSNHWAELLDWATSSLVQ